MTAERYTAVFTGLLSVKEPGEYVYLSMSEDLLGPEGSSLLQRGHPPYRRLGREIPYKDLPEECWRLVLNAFRKSWNL